MFCFFLNINKKFRLPEWNPFNGQHPHIQNYERHWTRDSARDIYHIPMPFPPIPALAPQIARKLPITETGWWAASFINEVYHKRPSTPPPPKAPCGPPVILPTEHNALQTYRYFHKRWRIDTPGVFACFSDKGHTI